MTRVLVLGASGFVGRNLVAALAALPEFEPVALVRRRSPAIPADLEQRWGDATDPAAVKRALDGVGAVVNCIAGPGGTTVAATRTLCEAATALGLRRLVHLSSMAVYGAATGTVDESHPLDGSMDRYAAAKIACERMVRSAQGLETVILRPGCIHGPGSPQWTLRIARLLRQHRIGDLGENGDGTCNLTYIDDMLRAIVAALRRDDAAGGTFNVSDPDPGRWNDYLVDLGRAIGAVPVTRISRRWQTIETRLLAPPLVMAERALGRAHLGRSLPASLTPSMARLFRQEITLDSRRADAGLAFIRTPRRAAVAAAARWLCMPL